MTPIYDNDTVQKVANYKDHNRWNYKAFSQHMPVIDPIDHCPWYRDRFKLARAIQPYWSLHSARSARSIEACMTMLLQNYPRVIFFSFATFQSVSFLINRRQTWTIYGLWRKMMYQKVDKKIPQRSVIIMSPYNIQIDSLAHHTSADFLSFFLSFLFFSFFFFFFFFFFFLFFEVCRSSSIRYFLWNGIESVWSYSKIYYQTYHYLYTAYNIHKTVFRLCCKYFIMSFLSISIKLRQNRIPRLDKLKNGNWPRNY